MEKADAAAERVILGLDPGLARVGYAVLAQAGEEMRALDFGVIQTAAAQPVEARILRIATACEALLAEYRVQEAALEELFFARNVSSALGVAQVRGALYLLLARAGLPIRTFAPVVVKQALCGRGRASKSEVAGWVARRLGLPAPPRQADAADALAIAITAGQSQRRAGEYA